MKEAPPTPAGPFFHAKPCPVVASARADPCRRLTDKPKVWHHLGVVCVDAARVEHGRRSLIGMGEPMIKSELVQKLADKNPELHHKTVERVVTTVFNEIVEALARGQRVELRGFGAFSTRARVARTGRNPRTGEAVPVDAKHVPYFKCGKELRERLNK